jgi:hypothetical protein
VLLRDARLSRRNENICRLSSIDAAVGLFSGVVGADESNKGDDLYEMDGANIRRSADSSAVGLVEFSSSSASSSSLLHGMDL